MMICRSREEADQRLEYDLRALLATVTERESAPSAKHRLKSAAPVFLSAWPRPVRARNATGFVSCPAYAGTPTDVSGWPSAKREFLFTLPLARILLDHLNSTGAGFFPPSLICLGHDNRFFR
jgi:hypothetical protein